VAATRKLRSPSSVPETMTNLADSAGQVITPFLSARARVCATLKKMAEPPLGLRHSCPSIYLRAKAARGNDIGASIRWIKSRAWQRACAHPSWHPSQYEVD